MVPIKVAFDLFVSGYFSPLSLSLVFISGSQTKFSNTTNVFTFLLIKRSSHTASLP